MAQKFVAEADVIVRAPSIKPGTRRRRVSPFPVALFDDADLQMSSVVNGYGATFGRAREMAVSNVDLPAFG